MTAVVARPLFLCLVVFPCSVLACAQSGTNAIQSVPEATSTSTDFFAMPGSDFDRPGLVPKANLNVGIGHTFGLLKKNPFGDELTFSYTYENAGSHGFFHTDFGSHTEAVGIMKNFGLPRTKVVTGYTWSRWGSPASRVTDMSRIISTTVRPSVPRFTSTITIPSGSRSRITRFQPFRGTQPLASDTRGAGKPHTL